MRGVTGAVFSGLEREPAPHGVERRAGRPEWRRPLTSRRYAVAGLLICDRLCYRQVRKFLLLFRYKSFETRFDCILIAGEPVQQGTAYNPATMK